MKTLFFFKNNAPTYFEIIAETLEDAQIEIKRITGNYLNNPPVLTHLTQNYSCPKCSCNATECNA